MNVRGQKQPKLTETLVVREWRKDRDGNEVFVVKLEPYEGTDLLTIRVWWRDQQGELRPGKKGIAISARHMAAFFEAMRAAENIAREQGLIKNIEATDA